MNEDLKYISVGQLGRRYGVATSTIWRWVTKGAFPQPVRLSDCCTRWRLDHVEQHDAEKEAANDSGSEQAAA